MTNQSRFSSLVLSLIFLIFLSACGGGDLLSPTTLTAGEAKTMYGSSPQILQGYGDEQTLNPDLTVVYEWSCVPMSATGGRNGGRIIASVFYKGKEIQNAHSMVMGCYNGLSIRHGFTQNGSYIIAVEGGATSFQIPTTKIFVDGNLLSVKPSKASFRINGITDLSARYGGEWILVNAEYYETEPLVVHITNAMGVINIRTGELVTLG